ncbi:hypothetical protein NQ176_g7668 [Zarea fungicola]|uniref:Uncharacterized protein n=1 Tax=Zarea fungicola TaxID=93591 RepID=A0ACC1MZ05_9HYPO|nr:hypothetical protein NQ176_g7668 [Lecanicillium fungicola]
MIAAIVITLLISSFNICNGQLVFEEQYRTGFVPQTIETPYGPQVVAPDTPYVAAAGRDKLYFIDTRFDEETAWHIKQQIERSQVPRPGEYIAIDEIKATAEVRKSGTNETVFVFDPAYARVIFAKGINKRNPALNLPEHEPAGDWLTIWIATATKIVSGDQTETAH